MVYAGILCTEAEIEMMRGYAVESAGDTETNHNDLVSQAESFLNSLCRHNWSDGFAALNIDVKRILSEFCARYAAVQLILYNVDAIKLSEEKVNTMLAYHQKRMDEIVKLLEDQKTVTYIIGAT